MQFCNQKGTFSTLNVKFAYFVRSKTSIKCIILFKGMNITRLKRKILKIIDFGNGCLPTYVFTTVHPGPFCVPVLLNSGHFTSRPFASRPVCIPDLLYPGFFASRLFCIPALLHPGNFCIPALLHPGNFYIPRSFAFRGLLHLGGILQAGVFCKSPWDTKVPDAE